MQVCRQVEHLLVPECGALIRLAREAAGSDREPIANPVEVASIHRIALGELARPDSPRFVRIPESDRPVIQVPIGGDLIHAPTGAVIYQFRAVAYDGDSVRVDEYEQPVFAWR